MHQRDPGQGAPVPAVHHRADGDRLIGPRSVAPPARPARRPSHKAWRGGRLRKPPASMPRAMRLQPAPVVRLRRVGPAGLAAQARTRRKPGRDRDAPRRRGAPTATASPRMGDRNRGGLGTVSAKPQIGWSPPGADTVTRIRSRPGRHGPRSTAGSSARSTGPGAAAEHRPANVGRGSSGVLWRIELALRGPQPAALDELLLAVGTDLGDRRLQVDVGDRVRIQGVRPPAPTTVVVCRSGGVA